LRQAVLLMPPDLEQGGVGQGGRCLIVANVFPPVLGGSASVYDNLARYGRGRVCVLAPSTDYRTDEPLVGWQVHDAACGFRVYRRHRLRTPLRQPPVGLASRVALAAHDLTIRAGLIAEILRITRAQGIGTVCIGDLVACGWLARVGLRMFGLRSIIYVHGEEISLRGGYDGDAKRRRAALRSADAIVAVSSFTRDSLVSMMQVAPARITLISNGVDVTRFAPRPRRADLVARYGLAGRRVLLTVARLAGRKGIDRVIEALPAMLREMPDLTYLVVGDGPLREALQHSAEALGVAHAVVLAGAVPPEELVDHYALADWFIMANRTMPDGDTEGFGLVFLEANACGIPVIAGRAGGSTDAVRDGVNGITVDGDDPGAIAAAVGRLAGDAALCARLREQGLIAAGENGWQAKVDQFLRLCEG